MNDLRKLFLIDAYALIFRAYYAFIRNPIFNSKGLNTSAIYGFTNALDDIIKRQQPSHIAVVFDPPSPTFRHKMFKDYKANREETPEDIKLSVPYIKEIIKGFNIPIVEVGGYEADDVIATLAKKAEDKGYTIYMLTPDKDYAQLISENIYWYKPGRSGNDAEVIGIQELKQIFSVDRPDQVIDILALMGDASDNIPGVPGIGKKTANKLIADFKSIDNLYQNLHQVKGKQKENLIESKDLVDLSRKLVTLDKNVPVDFTESIYQFKEKNHELLKRVFNDLEFKSLASRILGDSVSSTLTQKQPVQTSLFSEQNSKGFVDFSMNLKTLLDINHTYTLIDSKSLVQVQSLVKTLSGLKEFCFDTETTGLTVHESEIVGISFSYKQHEAYYVEMPEEKEEAKKVLWLFKDVFENNDILKIGQNIKYDILMLKAYGIELRGNLFDTMIAHYLLQPELRHNLNYLAEIYLQYKPITFKELVGEKSGKDINIRQVNINRLCDYACEDADITFQLKTILQEELKKNDLERLFTTIEMPLIYVLTDMEFFGVAVDIKALYNYSEVVKKEIVRLRNKIISLAGIDFNISSPKQLGEILFERLKIAQNIKKTKSKQYSTSEQVLLSLRNKHEIIGYILEYRSYSKLLSSYIDSLPKLINAITGKIHTSFNQSITSTGRLSSNNPNLQNIPIREERGREIRNAFISSNMDNLIVSADYSQIELRLMAHLSEDTDMINAFNNNEDIHTLTAAKIFKVNIVNVTKEMRYKAKTANFGIIYGISAFGLAQRLNISRSDAKDLIDGYFNTYKSVSSYIKHTISEARRNKFVRTIMGRVRYLPDINSSNSVVRGVAERNAINAPIQGSAADIIKLAMINIWKIFIKQNLKSKMILQVHDELVFDVHKKELDLVKDHIKREMEHVIELKVPLTIEIGTGSNWLEAH